MVCQPQPFTSPLGSLLFQQLQMQEKEKAMSGETEVIKENIAKAMTVLKSMGVVRVNYNYYGVDGSFDFKKTYTTSSRTIDNLDWLRALSIQTFTKSDDNALVLQLFSHNVLNCMLKLAEMIVQHLHPDWEFEEEGGHGDLCFYPEQNKVVVYHSVRKMVIDSMPAYTLEC